MIYGIGIDIVEVGRIERAYERWGLRFAEKILGPAELDQFAVTKAPVRFHRHGLSLSSLGVGL